MSKQYEELSALAQSSLHNLRKEILRGDIDLTKLENNAEGFTAFLGFCAGYLRGQGCSMADATAAVTFARTKDFWLLRKAPTEKVEVTYSGYDMGVSCDDWDGTY
jgi:hypothetical protein